MPVSSQLVSMPEHEGFGAVHVHAPASAAACVPISDSADTGRVRAVCTWMAEICGFGRVAGTRPRHPPAQVELHHDRVDVVGLVVPRRGGRPRRNPPSAYSACATGLSARTSRNTSRTPRRAASSSSVASSARPRPRPRPPSAIVIVWMSASARPACRAQPGVADQAPGLFDDDVPAVRRGELLAHHRVGPGVARERCALERHDRVEVVEGRRGHARAAHARDPLRVRAAGSHRASAGTAARSVAGTRPAATARPATIASIAPGTAAGVAALGAELGEARIELLARDERGLGRPHRQAVVVDPVVHRERELAAARIGHDREPRVARCR